MKKILCLMAFYILFVTSSHAQLPPVSITVDNRTGCDVYCDLWGKDYTLGSCAMSMFLQNSTILTFSPGTTIYTSPAMVPIGTLGTSDQFVAADIYDQLSTCGTPTLIGTVGEPCGSYNGSTGIYTVYNSGCGQCSSNVTATWNAANSTLTFQ